MAYMEPGAYLTVVPNPQTVTSPTPGMIPLIIGTAATYVPESNIVIRNGIDTRTDPSGSVLLSTQDYSLNVKYADIVTIGFSPEIPQFTFSDDTEAAVDCIIEDKNYTDGDGNVVPYVLITWTPDGLTKIPDGARYYATYKSLFADEKPKLITDPAQVTAFYGPYSRIYDPPIDGQYALNNLATCAYIALQNGAAEIYTIAVVPGNTGVVGETLTAAYARLLKEEAFYLPAIWRICPADCPVTSTSAEFKTINLEVDKHIRLSSTYEERKERVGIYGYTEYNPTFPDLFNENLRNYAMSKRSSRISVMYPYKVSMNLPGVGYSVGGPQFLCAAYTGLEGSMPGFQPKTRYSLQGISEILGVGSLVGPRLDRNQLNSIASAGVMIVTQDAINSLPVIRHQLTTNMDSVDLQENSVVAVKDYCTKVFRGSCENYIGRYNITNDMIERLNGTLNSDIKTLMNQGWITDGEVVDIARDVESPDKLLVKITITVPRPCNIIDITLYVE